MNKTIEKRLVKSFNANYISLSGIVKLLKSEGSNKDELRTNTLFYDFLKELKIEVAKVTPKNLSYFLKVEFLEKETFSVSNVTVLLRSAGKFIETNATINKINCRRFQLACDLIRLEEAVIKIESDLDNLNADLKKVVSGVKPDEIIEAYKLRAKIADFTERLTTVKENISTVGVLTAEIA